MDMSRSLCVASWCEGFGKKFSKSSNLRYSAIRMALETTANDFRSTPPSPPIHADKQMKSRRFKTFKNVPLGSAWMGHGSLAPAVVLCKLPNHIFF